MPLKHSVSTGLSKASILLYAAFSAAILGAVTAMILFRNGLSGETDKDAEREILAVAVTKDELAKIE